MSRLLRFPLLSEQQVANSPSRKDGMTAQAEARIRKTAAKHIYSTGHVFKMSVGTPAIAVTLFLRYFARKSMVKNEPFIIAAGALFLAGKVNDEQVPAQNLVVELFKQWYGRDNPLMRQRLADNAFLARLFPAVFEAERAILYTVGFDFNVDLPHTQIALLLRLPRFAYLQRNMQFHQLIVNFCNDVLRLDGSIVLQYPAREIAVAIYYYVFKMVKGKPNLNIPQPETEPDGTPWFVKEGVEQERCAELVRRIHSLYKTRGTAGAGGAASSQPAASAATTTAVPGTSTAALPGVSVGMGISVSAAGAAASVAAGRPQPAVSVGMPQQQQEEEAVESTARPTAAVVAAAPVAGQKRGLEGAGSPPPPVSKAPRQEAAPAVAAMSSLQGPKAEAAPAAVPGTAADGSEPEEGEIEEGELPG